MHKTYKKDTDLLQNARRQPLAVRKLCSEAAGENACAMVKATKGCGERSYASVKVAPQR